MKTQLDNINIGFMRNALYSFRQYNNIPKNTADLDHFVLELWNDEVFRESVFLASYELYNEWARLCQNDSSLSQVKRNRINNSILKYYIRITTRSTPFGTFASHSAFELNAEHKNIETGNMDSIHRYTTLDLSFLFQVIALINRDFPEVHEYELNDSVYKLGDYYRYIETTVKNEKRVYTLSSLEKDELLDFLVENTANKSYSFDALVALVAENVEGVSEEDAKYYIFSLIDAQFFKSNFDICLNEHSPLCQIIEYLHSKKGIAPELDAYLDTLIRMDDYMKRLNSGVGQPQEYYSEIFALANQFSILYDRKYLINSSLKRTLDFSPVTREDLSKIKKGINTLACFWDKGSETVNENLEKFKTAFYTRYEESLVPLVEVLDNESGIGYIQEQNSENDFSSLLDTLSWPNSNTDSFSITYNKKIHEFWRRLINKANINGETSIDLSQHDISNLQNTEEVSLARSLAVMIEKVSDKIAISSVGGTSGANLIARFSNEDEEILAPMNRIIKEEQNDDHFIYAELLHLPDNRAGNILLRQVKRGNQLSYLTKPSASENTISLTDLYIKMIDKRIVLFHKEQNKEVKIFHSTAHNFDYNSLPVYQFLCDLQHQDISTALVLNIGDTNYLMYDYIPRITFGNDIIFTPALWRVYQNEVSGIKAKNNTESIKKLKEYLSDKKVNRYFFIAQGDNKLLIDTENDNLLLFLVDELRSKEMVTLTECLYDLEADEFNNEIIIPMINRNYTAFKTELDPHLFNNNIADHKFIPGNKWLYYKIYCGNKFSDKILQDVFPELLDQLNEEDLIKKWFYIRYSDPDNHIRLRLEINDNDLTNTAQIITTFNDYFDKYISEGIINKVEMGTYDREYERYEGEFIDTAEHIFHYDSKLTVNLLKNIPNNDDLWLYAIKSIDVYFDVFRMDLDKRHEVISKIYTQFQKEFNVDSNLKKQLDLKYRSNLNIISEIVETDGNPYFSEFVNAVTENCKEIEKLRTIQKERLVSSFIHMHINRLIRSRHRMHELIIYGIVEKYYKMKIGKRKYLVS
ncbi:lantibiotic dehydratase [Chryseobacterium sp. RU33C]|uniref:lantibiotic dehydratase n=1 Tax=Chryseobacterium sp. RU33C TaxID=1907398 RepID=UPI000955810D|nr:lantibiotic dehydratase [Chryseobacterium sp. RU33C]SIQ32290.1 thiopeptide-type bacteriocin biosynthesis domain-containing protein [Chryseobacterium sp. RU33C]